MTYGMNRAPDVFDMIFPPLLDRLDSVPDGQEADNNLGPNCLKFRSRDVHSAQLASRSTGGKRRATAAIPTRQRGLTRPEDEGRLLFHDERQSGRAESSIAAQGACGADAGIS